eukprot:CAMPEP_0184867140 /NCGR_PEP_ID=MMETSP0580-20130426/25123_1 /TAXON_ID=1118495 /ORGANISM="Dactyliosolen fragilissimus" /LENGTH=258 /DNA_ID=CAMNT_0027367201 /DNA_START=65 /DNA_END=841 /DNA_ORIENTATION=-
MSPSEMSKIKPSEQTKSTKDVKGILFDIDGTLADSWKLGFDATQEVLSRNGIPLITEEDYHYHTRYCTPDRLARHAGYLPDTHQKEFLEVGEKLGKQFDDLYVDLVSVETARFYDGIASLLNNLPLDSGVKVGALTNACAAYGHAVLKANCPVSGLTKSHDRNIGIYDIFSSIHGADTAPKPKPEPDGLFLCCEEMGVNAENCVYIGDSPSDGLAAKNAGMLAIGVTWGSHSEDNVKNAPFDHVVGSVDELGILLPRK